MINLVDSVTYLDLVPWVALAEMILIVYGYGAMRLIEDMQFMTGDTPSTYLVVCWRYICPLALVVSLQTDQRLAHTQ
ncbi:sodium-dependent neutral amino acid transporter B(0)AT1-like [Amblyomma americanum]